MSMTYFSIRKFEPRGAGQLFGSWHSVTVCLFFCLFVLSYCSWGSCGENTGVVCHSLLQWTHVLSELATMTRAFWVALHNMVHRFIELCKPLYHNKTVIHEGVPLNGI